MLDELVQTPVLQLRKQSTEMGTKVTPQISSRTGVRAWAPWHLILQSFHHTLPCILPQSCTPQRSPGGPPTPGYPEMKDLRLEVPQMRQMSVWLLPSERRLFELEMTVRLGHTSSFPLQLPLFPTWLSIYLSIYVRLFFFPSELRLQGSKMLCICKAHNL